MTKTSLSIAEIQATWKYEKETGLFRWDIYGPKITKGAVTGSSNGKNSYVVLKTKSEKLYAHRVAFVMVFGRWPTHKVDHINGNKKDNRFCNLRESTQAQNLRNKAVKGDSLTRVKGVTQDKRDGRFYAYIDVDGKRTSLGGFDTANLASLARRKAEIEYHEGYAYGDQESPPTTSLESKPDLSQPPETS